MPLPKTCSCKNHETIAREDAQVQNITTCKKYKKAAINYLLSNGLMESHNKFLCNDCYQYALNKTEQRQYSISEICDLINNDALDDDQVSMLAGAIGKKFKAVMSKNTIFPDVEILKKLNAKGQISKIDKRIYTFLSSLCNDESKQEVEILNAYEHLSNLSNIYYIGPLNFCLNILFHFITGSKQVLELRSKYSPSGSYTKALEYLNTNSETPLELTHKKDCILVFDNNQVMARSWNVQLNSKASISVITTVACLVPPQESNYQNNTELKPNKWSENKNELSTTNHTSQTLLRQSRNLFIESKLKSINDELNENDEQPRVKKSKIDSVANSTKSDPYDSIESRVLGKTEIHVLDPVMVNPCSFQSLEIVLDSLLLKKTTEWIAVVCDGLPFNLCSKMIDNYHICPTCQILCKKITDFEKHLLIHPTENLSSCNKYGSILLLPGFGHMEINITKAMFKLLWDICLKELAILLGWKSLKALTACYKCTDHHKAWQILQIYFKSASHVLLEFYVNECISNNENPSVQGLYRYYQKQNKNYIILFKCTFSYMHALDMFRMAVRRGHFSMMLACLNKLSQLFYGLNMTIYMDINYKFDKIIQQAPKEITEFIAQNICLSQSGHPSRAEGCDFILENVNKKIKAWLPPGIPTEDRWLRICRNLNCMEDMKQCIENKLTGDKNEQPPPYFRTFKQDDAVEAFKTKLRTYLRQAETVSMNNQRLDHDLINFDHKCEANKEKFYQNYPNAAVGYEKVFITVDDRTKYHDINNKTKATIQSSILNIIEQIDEAGGAEEADVLKQQWTKEIKSGSKDVYLSFYKEVVQALEEVTAKERNETAAENG